MTSQLSAALFPLSLGAVLLVGLIVALAWGPMRRETRMQLRLGALQDSYPAAALARQKRGSLPARIAGAIGGLFTRSGLLSSKAIADLESTLSAAGLRGGQALPVFVGAKFLLLVAGPLAGMVLVRETGWAGLWAWAVPAGSGIVGLLAPDIALRTVRARYLAAVERAMPDALDLLVICSEAGLALEQGIERVAREIRVSSMPCATELALTSDELRIMSDRRAALHNMARRTGLVSLQRLAGTLAQALQYGTPLAQALRTLSAELRGEALTRFEARAARLPVLLTLPMIVLILPCVFLIVVGPAAMAIIDAMHNR
jgi:tight adherence protein C